MSEFSPAETAACCHLIELAFKEDFGNHMPLRGDITTMVLIPPLYFGHANFVIRTDGIVAGLPAVGLVLGAANPELRLQHHVEEGASVTAGQCLATVATLTRRFVDAIRGTSAKILDTRKTTPGWRLLEKYAVRCGGGCNHRMGLYDQFLIKDNHLAARPNKRELPLRNAVQIAKRFPLDLVGDAKPTVAVEIEVDTLDQFDDAIAGAPDIILLDNMPLDMMREAVKRRNAVSPSVLLEASGGVTLQTVRAIAETGVDRISVGALTHSAPALDIALDYRDAE
jgi:nicotinate-nucleotide pyrophosphorylase (carboxylating)